MDAKKLIEKVASGKNASTLLEMYFDQNAISTPAVLSHIKSLKTMLRDLEKAVMREDMALALSRLMGMPMIVFDIVSALVESQGDDAKQATGNLGKSLWSKGSEMRSLITNISKSLRSG